MNQCNQFEQDLVALAHGEAAADAQRHVDHCDRCAVKLAELRAIVSGMRVPQADAPDWAVARAQALMPERPKLLARLVQSTLALSGARSEDADSFQMVYEADPMRARLLYERTATGWSVTGQVEGDVTDVEVGGRGVPIEGAGRFAFLARTLADTECTVTSEGRLVVIPAAALIKPDGHEPPA